MNENNANLEIRIEAAKLIWACLIWLSILIEMRWSKSMCMA